MQAADSHQMTRSDYADQYGTPANQLDLSDAPRSCYKMMSDGSIDKELP